VTPLAAQLGTEVTETAALEINQFFRRAGISYSANSLPANNGTSIRPKSPMNQYVRCAILEILKQPNQ
jgi:hypothetical protein